MHCVGDLSVFTGHAAYTVQNCPDVKGSPFLLKAFSQVDWRECISPWPWKSFVLKHRRVKNSFLNSVPSKTVYQSKGCTQCQQLRISKAKYEASEICKFTLLASDLIAVLIPYVAGGSSSFQKRVRRFSTSYVYLAQSCFYSLYLSLSQGHIPSSLHHMKFDCFFGYCLELL